MAGINGKNWLMNKAFVFGKFLPFHKGHEAMIKFALSNCNFLTVLVCCSDKETLPGIIRKTWIEETFFNQKNIEVRSIITQKMSYPILPNLQKTYPGSGAKIFTELFSGYQLLVTSEPYGDFCSPLHAYPAFSFRHTEEVVSCFFYFDTE